MRFTRAAVWGVMLAVLASGCRMGTMDDEEFDRLYGDRIKGPGGLSMFYGDEAAVLAATLLAKLGPEVQVKSLTLYYDRAMFEAQTKDDATRKLRYQYQDGDLDPDETSSPISTSEAAEFYQLADVLAADLPASVQTAHKALGAPGKFVRMVNVNLDRNYPEYLAARAQPGSDDARLRRMYLGPEADPRDRGIRLTFFFGESSAFSRVEMDTWGHVLEVSHAQVAVPGELIVEEPVLFQGTTMADAATRLHKALGHSPMRLVRILVYPSYASFEVEDPAVPGSTDTYDFRNGRWSGNASRHTRSRDADLLTFDLADAELQSLSKWVDSALPAGAQATISTYVIVEGTPGSPQPRVQVYATVDGQTRWYTMTPGGTIIKEN